MANKSKNELISEFLSDGRDSLSEAVRDFYAAKGPLVSANPTSADIALGEKILTWQKRIDLLSSEVEDLIIALRRDGVRV